MNARLCKRSAVAGSALILALAPLGLQPVAAAAATPSQTHASAVESQRDYQRGFRDGFRDGYQDARDDCLMHKGYRGYSSGNRDYTRGYSSGYSAGFARAEDRYC
ncbi:hypothetical protein ACWCRF_15855 [Streptomyces sp. NPDC002405]|uniref:hypothetical protein n=1 Tax=unclassified Streptomyces TaxID=2593676 RepID=UPI00368DAB74